MTNGEMAMPTISKPCFCCGGCCSDGSHDDLLADGELVTLPDIVPSNYPPCSWTPFYTATVKSGRKVGLAPVVVAMADSCDFGIWIRPEFVHKTAVEYGTARGPHPPQVTRAGWKTDLWFLGGRR